MVSPVSISPPHLLILGLPSFASRQARFPLPCRPGQCQPYLDQPYVVPARVVHRKGILGRRNLHVPTAQDSQVPTLSLQPGSSTPYHAVPSISHNSRLTPLSHPHHHLVASPRSHYRVLLLLLSLLALDSCLHRRQPPSSRIVAARRASTHRNSTAPPETSNPLLITAVYSPTHTDHATGWHILPCLGRPTASC